MRKIFLGTSAALLTFLACVPPYDVNTFFIGWMACLALFEMGR